MEDKKLYEEFADKQVVDDLIKDLAKVINTQNNLIDKLKIWETQIMDNFISLRKQIRVNREDNILLEEGFTKEVQIQKDILKKVVITQNNLWGMINHLVETLLKRLK